MFLSHNGSSSTRCTRLPQGLRSNSWSRPVPSPEEHKRPRFLPSFFLLPATSILWVNAHRGRPEMPHCTKCIVYAFMHGTEVLVLPPFVLDLPRRSGAINWPFCFLFRSRCASSVWPSIKPRAGWGRKTMMPSLAHTQRKKKKMNKTLDDEQQRTPCRHSILVLLPLRP